jgi:hypothetical protein
MTQRPRSCLILRATPDPVAPDTRLRQALKMLKRRFGIVCEELHPVADVHDLRPPPSEAADGPATGGPNP